MCKPFLVDFDPYEREVLVIVGKNPAEQFKKWLPASGKNLNPNLADELDTPPRLEGRFIPLDSGSAIIWIKNKPTTPKTIAVLAHEVLHTVVYVMEDIGMPLKVRYDEAYTYALEHLLKVIIEKTRARDTRTTRRRH